MLYRRAAEQGKAAAQFNYALMLASGQGVQQNEEAAGRWLRRAAESGDARAQYELGRLCASGGTGGDPIEAHVWFGLAEAGAESGIADRARTARAALAPRLDADALREAERRLRERIGGGGQ